FNRRKKTVKDKKITNRKKIASPLVGQNLKINEMLRKKNVEIEAKRIAKEEEAAKDKEEEETEDNDVNVNENEDEADNEEDADNNEEDDDNEEDADNEDQADNEENVDQVFRNIKMLPFLNAAKRSKKKEDGKESPKRFTRGDAKRQAELEKVNPQNKAEDVKSISSDDVIVETKKKGRKSKGKKEGKR
ncbi:hypothetical protein Tco_1379786, partial [Tanacetum coccineum]